MSMTYRVREEQTIEVPVEVRRAYELVGKPIAARSRPHFESGDGIGLKVVDHEEDHVLGP